MGKFAFLLGIDKYPNLGDLRCARNDAIAFGKAIQQYWGFAPQEVVVITDKTAELTREYVLKRMREAYNKGDLTYFIFGFWGHGYLEDDKVSRRLCLPATDIQQLASTSLSFDDLANDIKQIGALNTLLYTDCCNTLPGRGSNNMTDDEELAFSKFATTVSRNVQATRREKHYALDVDPTIAILNACSRNQKAYEIPNGEHGVFTYSTLQAMRDLAQRGNGSIGDLASEVNKRVKQVAAKYHFPQSSYSEIKGAGVFAFPVAGSVKQTRQATTPQETKTAPAWEPPKTFWEKVKFLLGGGTSVNQWETFSKMATSSIDWLGSTPGEQRSIQIKGVEYKFSFIPKGSFMMGSPSSEAKRCNDETQHRVNLSQDFWLGSYPVTQELYKAVTGEDPSTFKGAQRPVESVNWNESIAFVNELNSIGVAPSGWRFNLPTEAQWEYACRAGTSTPYNFGSRLNGDKANCDGDVPYGTDEEGACLGETSDVGSYAPNAWNLFDMHGNVWEWLLDWYGAYPENSVTDPTGPATGSRRVLRGGGWLDYAGYCRSARRSNYPPSYRIGDFGFRLALVCK